MMNQNWTVRKALSILLAACISATLFVPQVSAQNSAATVGAVDDYTPADAANDPEIQIITESF